MKNMNKLKRKEWTFKGTLTHTYPKNKNSTKTVEILWKNVFEVLLLIAGISVCLFCNIILICVGADAFYDAF